MSWGAAIIIILAVGIIWSNIMLLKKTAHMKMPDLLKKQTQTNDPEDKKSPPSSDDT